MDWYSWFCLGNLAVFSDTDDESLQNDSACSHSSTPAHDSSDSDEGGVNNLLGAGPGSESSSAYE